MLSEFVRHTAKGAGELALNYYKKEIKVNEKDDRSDLVTEADTAVENYIVKEIKKHYPEHGIIGEEGVANTDGNSEYVWVIDPIDGTRNFANHIAFWCVMIGIEKDGKPYMGCVYDAIND